MRTEIKELHQRLKTTTIFVTHDQIEAMTMADKIVVMDDGRIEQIGSPLELYNHPKNEFVAKFIGSPAMNLIQGTVRRGGATGGGATGGGATGGSATGGGATGGGAPGGGATGDSAFGVEVNGHRLPISADSGAEDGQSVIYGIRPEHLDIADDGFPARVSVVEPTGSETLVFLRFGETDIVAVLHDWHDFNPGQTVHLRPRAERAHLFDVATGARV
jgi:multiple sugar transport system ATP-binding protein